jgi:3-hydroxybutyryl-CoA dehydrogenase
VAPLGFDVTTVAVVERLDPARTIGIDMLIDDAATQRRVLATNPATRATCAMRRTPCWHATASP